MIEGRWIPRSTPFPNILIDQMMPRLCDTEWRVVVVITRATLGWKDEITGGRKQREWLSSRQLRARTGRESAAISQALDNLLKARIISITDGHGRPLSTAAERRRQRTKLSFGLHPDILERL